MQRIHRYAPWRTGALLALVMAGLMAFPAIPAASAPRLITFPYHDDFDYVPNWTVKEGTWRYLSGSLNGSGIGTRAVGYDARIIAGDPAWQCCSFAGRFRIIAGTEAGILFRVGRMGYGENVGDYYQVINSVSTGLTLHRVSDGKSVRNSTAYAFLLNVWYDFKVTLNGSKMDYFVNSTWMFNYTQLDFASGCIGLKAYRSTCQFDDIVVKDLQNNNLFSDSFSSNPCGGWDPQKGTWRFTGGEYQLNSDAARDDLTLSPVTAPSGRWTAQVRLSWFGGTNFQTGLCFGYQNATSYYLAFLSAPDQTIRVMRRDGATVNDRWAQASLPVKKETWYGLTVLKDGLDLTLYVNSARVLNKTDSDPLPGEGFGLASRSDSQEWVRFDYIEIQDGANPPKPDLVIDPATQEVYPTHPNIGDDVLFKFSVQNNGTADCAGNFSVRLVLDGMVLAAAYPDNILAAGLDTLVFIHWKANISGNLSLVLTADATNLITESNETNNNLTVQLPVNARPVAVFVMSPEGQAFVDQEVQFNATGSSDGDGKLVSYIWNFGDRAGASVVAPRHAYQSPGTYSIVLNVTDNDGSSAIAGATITVVYRIPQVNITWTPATGDITTQFNFRFQLYDPDKLFSGFRWDFGDGNTTTDQAPMHRFSDDATYNITYVIFYNQGRNTTQVQERLVVQNTPPAVRIVAASTQLSRGQQGYFRACVTDPDDFLGPLGLMWSFPDGMNYTGEEVWHAFNRSGHYRITLTAFDEWGANGTAFILVDVAKVPPNASFPLPAPAYNDTPFLFDMDFLGPSAGSLYTYSWAFGDGTNASGIKVWHNYSAPGNYTVTLTITDDEGATNSSTGIVWVRAVPLPPVVPPPENEPFPVALALIAVTVVVLAIALAAWVGLRTRARQGPGGGGPSAPKEDEQGPGGLQG